MSRGERSVTGGGVRPARPADVAGLLALVRDLAAYEREPDAVEATEGGLREALFGTAPAVFAHVVDAPDATLAGMAVWYVTFSTWVGRHGIWLEDLYVRPEHRGRGYGHALLRALAATCVERGYGRLEWWVLDWNAPALGFYRAAGAVPQDGWTVQRVDGPALRALATPPIE